MRQDIVIVNRKDGLTMNIIRYFNSFLLILTISPGVAFGQGTIFTVSGPSDTNSQSSAHLGTGVKPFGFSWISAGAFSNVNVSLSLNADPGATAIAYLTTSIGPGTTESNEIASANFAFPSTFGSVSVLSGLYLTNGTYFLIIQQTAAGINGDGLWNGTPVPSAIYDSAITPNHQYFYYSIPSPDYPPSASFSYSTALVPTLDFSITGVSVPEPTAFPLICLGSAFLIFLKRSSINIFWRVLDKLPCSLLSTVSFNCFGNKLRPGGCWGVGYDSSNQKWQGRQPGLAIRDYKRVIPQSLPAGWRAVRFLFLHHIVGSP
jgi:hypothetical protein